MSDVSHIEHAVLLRVPVPVAETIRGQLAEAPKTLPTGLLAHPLGHGTKENAQVKLTFTTEEGQVQLQIGTQGAVMQGQLVNLPSQIEVQKTFDQIHYYKVADIGQMIVIQSQPTSNNPTASLNSNPTRPKNSTADPSTLLPPIDFPSGLTPPTREIRPKRYERATKVPYRAVKEVDQLLSNIKDERTVHTFELVEEEEEIEIDEDEEFDQPQQQQQSQTHPSHVRDSTPLSVAPPPSSSHRLQTDDRPPSSIVRPHTGGTRLDQTGARTSQQLPTPSTAMRLSSPKIASQPLSSPRFDRSGPGATTGKRTGTEDHKQSMFGATPQLHAGDSDMVDVDTGDLSGLSSVPVSSSINVDSVEDIFGSPPVAAGSSTAGASGGSEDFLPSVASPSSMAAMMANDGFGMAPSPPPPAPPSQVDLLTIELADLNQRIEKATKNVSAAQNMILRKQAQQKLASLNTEKAALEEKIQAAMAEEVAATNAATASTS